MKVENEIVRCTVTFPNELAVMAKCDIVISAVGIGNVCLKVRVI